MNQKIILTIICVLLLIMGFKSCNKTQPTKPTQSTVEKTSETIQLTGLDGINYAIKNLPDNVTQYLKTTSEYKDLYSNKKLAIYYVGADCPYAQAFIDAIDPLREDSSYSEKYNFYPQAASGSKTFSTMEEAQADVDFSNICQEFCIIHPIKNQVFTINGIGYDEATKLGSIFEQLKDW